MKLHPTFCGCNVTTKRSRKDTGRNVSDSELFSAPGKLCRQNQWSAEGTLLPPLLLGYRDVASEVDIPVTVGLPELI